MRSKQLETTLIELKKAFAQECKDGPVRSRGYSPKLRTLALRALDLGVSVGAVTKEVGLSGNALKKWRSGVTSSPRKMNRPPQRLKAVELHVVPTEPERDAGVFEIHFKSGARLFLRQGDLTASIVAALNGGAV